MNSRNRSNHKDSDYRTDEYYKKSYGKDIIVVRLGHVSIVHTDHPDKKEIQKRTEEIMREEMTGEGFFDDCPLFPEFRKHPYDIVYYQQD